MGIITMSYKPEVADNLGKAGTWLSNKRDADSDKSKGGYVEEMLGTFFWIFLATQVDFFGLGPGFKFGVSWIIVSTVFVGQFNSMDTILRAVHGEDWLDAIFRLIFQALAGFLGCIVFGFFGLTDGADFSLSDVPSHTAFDIMSWVKLFLTFVVYFYAKTQLQDEKNKDYLPAWFGNILLFGLTFAIGGAGFLFAPNRVFFVGVDGIVGVLSTFWYVYIMYAVCGFLAAYVLNVLPSVCAMDWKKDNFLPTYKNLPMQGE